VTAETQKLCHKCGRWLPLDKFLVRKKSYGTYRCSPCLDCNKVWMANYYDKRTASHRAAQSRKRKARQDAIRQRTHKVCRYCNTDKPLEDFSKSKRSLDGRGTECKACHNARKREMYKQPGYSLREGRRRYFRRVMKNHQNKNNQLPD
jgi:hypothetical protein